MIVHMPGTTESGFIPGILILFAVVHGFSIRCSKVEVSFSAKFMEDRRFQIIIIWMFFPGDTFPKENSQSANGTVIASHAYHLAQAGGVILASQVTKYHLGFRFHEEAIITGEDLSPFYRETFIMRTIISTVRISTPALKAGIVPAHLATTSVYTPLSPNQVP